MIIMKKFAFVFGLILLMLLKSVLAQDVVSASGYITLEIKEPPKIVPIKSLSTSQSILTGFSIKEMVNKDASLDKNSVLMASIFSLLIFLIIFNIYQCIKYLQEQKSIA